jgi:DNA ligase
MGRIEHYCTRKAADINVGPETIDDLFELHLLENIDDIYKLTADDLAKLPNFKEKSINNLLTSIEQSKRHPFAQLLYGFGIRYVGEGTARTLAHHFRSIKRLSSATICELQALPDVGPKIAEQVVYYFSLDRNQRLIAELQRCGVILEETAEDLLKTVLSSRLEGERIVISGSFSQHSREEYKQIIEQHGGVNVGSISGRTTFVLAGSDMGPSKRAQAELLGIPLVTEEEFLSHLNS